MLSDKHLLKRESQRCLAPQAGFVSDFSYLRGIVSDFPYLRGLTLTIQKIAAFFTSELSCVCHSSCVPFLRREIS